MAGTAWLKRLAPDVAAAMAGDPAPWSLDEQRDLFIDAVELAVLGSLHELQLLGRVPGPPDLKVFESEPLDDWHLLMGPDQVAATLARIPPIEQWVAEHLDVEALGLVPPVSSRGGWDEPDSVTSAPALVASALRELAAFLADAQAASEVVVISLG
jgi:hypothetical protein